MKTLKATLLLLMTLLVVFVMPLKALAQTNNCELTLEITVTNPIRSTIILEDDQGNQKSYTADNKINVTLQFENVGEYIYKISQKGESEKVVYDTRGYKVVVEVIYQEDEIIPIVTIYDSDGLTKHDSICFVNKEKTNQPDAGDKMYLAISTSIISFLCLVETIHLRRKLENESK